MHCINPIEIKVKGFPQDVPCGKCGICLQNKRDEWAFRISRELKVAESAYFLTLTYSEENMPLMDIEVDGELLELPTLLKQDLQRFMKRLRKKVASIGLKMAPVKYYACGEYGSKTARPHYHVIIFNIPNEVKNKIEEIWKDGHVHVGEVTDASINYTLKYLINKTESEEYGREKQFALMSKGIGLNFAERNKERLKKRKQTYVVQNGYKKKMPRYIAEKVYDTEKEKEGIKITKGKEAARYFTREIEKLEKHSKDPYYYREEKLKNHEKTIKSKNNKNEKL